MTVLPWNGANYCGKKFYNFGSRNPCHNPEFKIVARSYKNDIREAVSLERKITHSKDDRKKFWECKPKARFTWEQNSSFQRWSQGILRMPPESQIHLRTKLFIRKMITKSFENGTQEPDSLENKIIHFKDDPKKLREWHLRGSFNWEQNYSFQRWSQEVFRMPAESQFHSRAKLFIQNMIARSNKNDIREAVSIENKIIHSKYDRNKFWECHPRARFTWEQNYSFWR